MNKLTISKDTYKQLSETLEMYGNYDMVEGLYPHYSGRGMFGDTCFGWVGNNPALVQLELARLIIEDRGMVVSEMSASDLLEELREELTQLHATTDSMGYSTIHYWRGIECAPECRSTDDDPDSY